MSSNISFPEGMKDIYSLLSGGYHLCIEDGETYKSLTSNEGFYRKLFSELGFKLSDGVDGTYYFYQSDEKISDTSRKMIIFISVMYDWQANQGKNPSSTITEEHFYRDSLPHLKDDEYKKTMRQIEVTDEAAINKILNSLKRYGFIDIIDDNIIRFKKTISYFVSIFERAADKESENKKGEENE